MTNMISTEVVRTLKWPTQQCDVQIHGINGATGQPQARKLVCQLLSRFNDEALATIELIVGQQLEEFRLPHTEIVNTAPLDMINELADPGLHRPAPIELLLGAGVWALVIKDGSFVNRTGIAFQPSRLGWLMFGGRTKAYINVITSVEMASSSEVPLDRLLLRFWEIEEGSCVRMRTADQECCEEIFVRTHRRLPNGRFQVDIPIRDGIKELGSSRAMALQRFRQLERRFDRDRTFKERYVKAINELICADQMRLADRPPIGWCYHIPHHAVQRKFRIVNDASCRTDRNISLNDAQLVGEKLQDDLGALLMRFRCHPVAVTADIKKMYLQVRVNPKQWDLQRIFWRPSPDVEILEYWLTSVTFGLASAPHCAVRAMMEGAREARTQFPMGAKAVEHDFYIDDCLSGAETESEARLLCHEMDALLRSCGFTLGKWRSNRPNVVPVDMESCTEKSLDLAEFENTTVLGLRWLPSSDELMFKYQPPLKLQAKEASKRRVLSHIAQIFDPNGFVGPVVVVAKMLMQRIWRAKIGWDQRVPDDIYLDWQRFQQQLSLVTEIRLPRWLGIRSEREVSVHGFADASTQAYGAALYIRVAMANQVECTLIAARSRVAPLKTVTIPRLELCAAQMLSELLHAFRATANLTRVGSTLWSDSQIVLAWLKKDASTLKTFVNNRVQKIHRLTADADWRHISSSDNPADLISRGTTAAELRNASLWWHGPSWLTQGATHWPVNQSELSSKAAEAAAKEEKDLDEDGRARQRHKHLAILSVTLRGTNLLARASKMSDLCRLTAWLLRFAHNTRQLGERSLHRRTGPLSNAELEAALELWVQKEQRLYYAKEVKALSAVHSEGIEASSPIASCTPRIDEKGLLRLGSRLARAPIPQAQRFPLLLPDVSPLAKLIIQEAHTRTLHGGPGEMIAYVRRKFWITNLRRAARTHNRQCVTCARHRRQATTQLMSELPADRVSPCRPFRHSGVDYAGPFMLKARGGRCNIMEKKYVAVFVCMVTKAVHLELVESLSTADFIQAFLRFTSIRGACTRLWSDNGKNFEGAAVELKRMLRSWRGMDMAKQLQQYGTEWRFITPGAPHQGGLWEAAVKSMKYHLRRVVGPHKLSSSAFHTILAQTSAVMNSRPLEAQSDDPEDLSFLTPAHFLIGEPIIQPFGANVQQVPDNRLKLAQLLQKMSQTFWRSWAQDYLHQLHQRTKWRQTQPNLKVGDLVIVQEDSIPPTLWKSARVIRTFEGSDGLVRNVQLRVATSDWEKRPSEKKVPFSVLERPVQRLCRLPMMVEAETSRAQGV